MVGDMLLQTKIPPIVDDELCTEISKIMLIVDDATTEIHLTTAENMLFNLIRKWKLSSNGQMNVICNSLHNKIYVKRNAYKIEDMNSANGGESAAH